MEFAQQLGGADPATRSGGVPPSQGFGYNHDALLLATTARRPNTQQCRLSK